VYWVDGTGYWDEASHWSLTSGGPGGAGQPVATDTAYLTQSTGAITYVRYRNKTNPGDVLAAIRIDETAGGLMDLRMTFEPGDNLSAVTEYVGYSGNGTFAQSKAVHTVTGNMYLGYNDSGHGKYYLSGGTFNAGDSGTDRLVVGRAGLGEFTHSGGTLNAAGSLYLGYESGSDGDYTLSGDFSQVSTNITYVGRYGRGDFDQTGGSHETTGALYLARYADSRGVYDISDGTLDVGTYLYVGYGGGAVYDPARLVPDGSAQVMVGSDVRLGWQSTAWGEMWLEGGTVSVNGDVRGGSGGSRLRFDGGTLNVLGGDIDVLDILVGGNPGKPGTMPIDDGLTVTTGAETIGQSATGSVVQTGGTHSVTGNLLLGHYAAGTYDLSGGVLTVGADFKIGAGGLVDPGPGDMSQTGGDVTVGGALMLGAASSNEGSYALHDGTLTVAGSACLGGDETSDLGAGSLVVYSGGSAEVGGELKLWSDGRVSIVGGTVSLADADAMVPAGGQLNLHIGTLQLRNDSTLNLAFLSEVLGSARTLETGQHLMVEGQAELQTSLVLDGGELSVEGLTNPWALDFKRGRFNMIDGHIEVDTSGPFGAALTVGRDQHYHAGNAVLISSTGRVRLEGGSLSARNGVLSFGLLEGHGLVETYFFNWPGSEIRVGAGEELTFTSPQTYTNEGDIRLLGGTLDVGGTLINLATGYVFGHGALIAAGGVLNDGVMAFSGDVADVYGDVDNRAKGSTIISSGGGTLTFYDDVNNDGEVRTSEGCATVFFGDVTGGGGFPGAGTTYFEGDLKPGASAAALAFGGDVVFGENASLEIEIGGPTPGREFDQVNVAGEATLDGTLAISWTSRLGPQVGQEFGIMTFGGRNGEFAATTGWLVGGLALVRLYGDKELMLHATYVGDANLDHQVGIADLSALADNYGSAPAHWRDGDFNDDGIVGIADLSALADHYGAGSGAAVPEPMTLALLAAGALIGLRRRRR
jgi:hypothetical protein